MKYTIIIPHKNTPDLLRRCLGSIPQRDDMEIIVVDDNSSSDKVDFEHFPGCERKDVRLVFNKEGKGAGNARNKAIPMAIGDYVIFADCDDFFNVCFNDILNDYAEADYDVVYFNANSVDSETYQPSYRVDHLHGFYDIYHKNPDLGILYFRYMFTEPWCKIIRRSLIEDNHIRFGHTVVVQDVVFAINVGDKSKKIRIDDRQGYCVTTRDGSLGQTVSLEAHEARFYVHAKWNKFLMDRKIPIRIPRYEYMLYVMSQSLYKKPSVYMMNYRTLKKCGYSHAYILRKTINNILMTLKLKIQRGGQKN